MIPVTEELRDRMVQAIVEAVAPEQVILFGSQTRDGAREASDVDLVVLDPSLSGRSGAGGWRRSVSTRHWQISTFRPMFCPTAEMRPNVGAAPLIMPWHVRFEKELCSIIEHEFGSTSWNWRKHDAT